jgi:hypothetical protein
MSDIRTAAVPFRAPRWSVWIAMLLCGCAIEPEPGWQAKLEQQIGGPDTLPGEQSALATPAALEDPAAGDGVVFAITLEQGERTRTWQLEVKVEEVAVHRALEFRDVQAFELRVQPGEARRRQIESSNAAFRKQLIADDLDLWDLARETPVARIRVEAFDASGASAGKAESTAIVSQLRRGLLPAARAGHRQRELMRGRVEAGLEAPMLTVDDDAYDDIRAVADGVASCTLFFQILQENPVTRQILREVLQLPSLWSLLTHWGVHISFAIDFFAAERVDPARFPGEQRELWSVPMTLLLNGQPGFLARVIVGPAGSPDGTAAGIYGIVARHPTDGDRRVRVRLLSSRRGARAPVQDPQGNAGMSSPGRDAGREK